MPKRIQRKRAAGWRMPEGAIYVGRPTKWGNPFQAGGVAHRRLVGVITPMSITGPGRAARFYRQWVTDPYAAFITGQRRLTPGEIRAELAGRDLVCWCPLDQPCHADVLLEIANSTTESEVTA